MPELILTVLNSKASLSEESGHVLQKSMPSIFEIILFECLKTFPPLFQVGENMGS